MGLGAVLGAGKGAFCTRLEAAKKAVWQGAGTAACASPLSIKFNLFIYYITSSTVQ